jgi:hypothetical protein
MKKCLQCKLGIIGTEQVGTVTIGVCPDGHRAGTIPVTAEMRAVETTVRTRKARGKKTTEFAEVFSMGGLSLDPAANDL